MQVPFKKSLHGCRTNFPDELRPLKFFFLDTFSPLCVGGSEGGAVFRCRFCTLITVVPEIASVSSRILSFCFPLIAFSLSSFNTTHSLSILDHCSCFNFPVPRIVVSDLYSSSPWSAIADNWASISSDESSCRTILMRF